MIFLPIHSAVEEFFVLLAVTITLPKDAKAIK